MFPRSFGADPTFSSGFVGRGRGTASAAASADLTEGASDPSAVTVRGVARLGVGGSVTFPGLGRARLGAHALGANETVAAIQVARARRVRTAVGIVDPTATGIAGDPERDEGERGERLANHVRATKASVLVRQRGSRSSRRTWLRR